MDAFTSTGNYLGTNRLGRSLTDAEREELGKVLYEHDFRQASALALRFALKQTKSKGRAEDLMARVKIRLVTTGWDPNAVTLKKRLLRLVWSEFMNDTREEAAAQRAEEVFLREQGIHHTAPLPTAPTRGDPLRPKSHEPAGSSVEHEVIAREEARQVLTERRKSFEDLRVRLAAKKDTIALEYLDQRLTGTEDIGAMAERTGHDVKVLYEAARRVRRTVERMVAEKNGVIVGDEDNERGKP